LSVPIAVALRVEEFDFVGIYQVAVMLTAGLFVIPGLGALAAFDENAALCAGF
jgi:hypothetical protein